MPKIITREASRDYYVDKRRAGVKSGWLSNSREASRLIMHLGLPSATDDRMHYCGCGSRAGLPVKNSVLC
jgi:hypothetical protein